MNLIDPYSPCPCGSGKKYKFCCLQKQRERTARESRPSFWTVSSEGDPESGAADTLLVGDAEEGFRLCRKGLQLMAESKFEQAIPAFRRSVAAAPLICTAANNLALCLFVTGNLQEAVRVQEESRQASPFPNPFGLANLATFHFVGGDEAAAQACLDEAAQAPVPSEDACVKVCETLARFRRHQAILDYADKSGYGGGSAVCFFTGVAAANAGDRRRAERDLSRVTLGHHKADLVRGYLQCLREGTAPHTVRGDWPYLLTYEVCPLDLIKAEFGRNQEAWLTRRVVVDVCEAALNESPDKSDESVKALGACTRSDATELLWAIAKGTFGPDSLRISALQCLQERGALDPAKPVEVVLDGKRREIALMGTRLNPDFRFGGQLPKALEKLYEKAISAGLKSRPDWDAIGATYLKIARAAPEYYPARYNYAISLLHRKRTDEAVPILRKLVAEQPEYLFAHATLLQIFAANGRMKQAESLVKSAPVPTETHPTAMAAWLVAQTIYHEAAGDLEEAGRCIESAHAISPDNPNVDHFWRKYKDREP